MPETTKGSTTNITMVQGIRLKITLQLIKIHVFLVALSYLQNLRKSISTVRKLHAQLKKYRGPKSFRKLVYVNGRYYWDMYAGGWPSKDFVRNVKRECKRLNSSLNEHVSMRNVLFGITTRCPLQCEHCFEWNNLNIREKLSFSDLQNVIEKLIGYGVGQIHLSGGEPMMRYEEVLELLKHYHKKVGFWIVSSGFHLTTERAKQLKASGLTGICVSIDHVDEHKHDAFRHYKQSFMMAKSAVAASNEAGLVTALSLCATKEFTNPDNLMAYGKMARQLGVSFVQILEPKAVGHFEGKPVHLSLEQKKLLQNFFLTTNNDSEFVDYPIVIYHEYYQKTLGCRGAGKGAFYIDPLGEVHACPFCRCSAGNVVSDPVENCVSNLWKKGCPIPETTDLVRKSQEILISN